MVIFFFGHNFLYHLQIVFLGGGFALFFFVFLFLFLFFSFLFFFLVKFVVAAEELDSDM